VTEALAGIFVGGAGRRMGGIAKGLMAAPEGGTLVERWRALLAARGVPVVLVGSRAEYAGLGVEAIADAPPGIGPLGGLVALLRRAGTAPALALACDMPFVSGALVDRLLAAHPEAPIVAPRREGRWEPLCARYDPSRVLATATSLAGAGEHSLQRLLTTSGAVELDLTPAEQRELHDWDRPEDLHPR
jgi:molybdopterin-guanine dinucleotide biosynthesis protein A